MHICLNYFIINYYRTCRNYVQNSEPKYNERNKKIGMYKENNGHLTVFYDYLHENTNLIIDILIVLYVLITYQNGSRLFQDFLANYDQLSDIEYPIF